MARTYDNARGRKKEPASPSRKNTGKKHEDDDQARVDDGAPHLERCLEDHLKAPTGLPGGPVEPQPPHDVLDIDDGIVHHFAQRNDESGKHHGIDGAACQRRTIAAPTSERGMASTLIKAVLQSKRNDTSTIPTKMQPKSRACSRFPRDRSMNVAGRKMAASISTSWRPGLRASSAESTCRVTMSVLPQGCFSTMSKRPGPSLITASPMAGEASCDLGDTSPSRIGGPSRKHRGTARSSARRWARRAGAPCAGWACR